MQQDRELRDLIRAAEKFRRRGDAHYPSMLKARISAWATQRREHGDWWTDISVAIGIPTQTLVRWCAATGSPASEMKAVEVIDVPPIGTVTIVAPSGLRTEGVSIDAAIAILRGIA